MVLLLDRLITSVLHARFVQSFKFLKKSWNLPCTFPDLEKVWKMEVKSGIMVKSLDFFSKAITSALQVKFFILVKFYSIKPIRLQRIMKKVLFLRFLRSLLITHLIIGRRNVKYAQSLSRNLSFHQLNTFCISNKQMLLKPWEMNSNVSLKIQSIHYQP